MKKTLMESCILEIYENEIRVIRGDYIFNKNDLDKYVQ